MAKNHCVLGSGNAPIPSDLIGVGPSAELLGLSSQSVRNLIDREELSCYRLPSGHRRLSRREVLAFRDGETPDCNEGKELLCVGYARTSTQSQKQACISQAKRVGDYCRENYPNHKLLEISDNSSGANFDRKGLIKVLELIESGQLDNGGKIVAEFRDRIGRMAVPLIEKICDIRKIELVYIEADPNATDEELLMQDVVALLHVFNCKTYSKRGAKLLAKPLSVEQIELGQKLHNEGMSARLIKEEFAKRKMVNADGSPITRHQVAKYIKINEVLQKVAPKTEKNSAELFAEKLARRTSENVRTPMRKAYAFYQQWCEAHQLTALNARGFGKVFRQYRQISLTKNGEVAKAWVGLEIDGVPSYAVKSQQTVLNEVDGFLAFLGSARGFEGQLKELADKYSNWVTEKGIKPLKKNKLKPMLASYGCVFRRSGGRDLVAI